MKTFELKSKKTGKISIVNEDTLDKLELMGKKKLFHIQEIKPMRVGVTPPVKKREKKDVVEVPEIKESLKERLEAESENDKVKEKTKPDNKND